MNWIVPFWWIMLKSLEEMLLLFLSEQNVSAGIVSVTFAIEYCPVTCGGPRRTYVGTEAKVPLVRVVLEVCLAPINRYPSLSFHH